ncbi:GFA family protein [Aliiroseovarius subalbicans]|uniref:GFA family protein n=1 Tax=Aliiroseovarius subalbicans TaxID=2925840 RepID=UPI001F598BC0|nr:GFA family protein [Aliiroseovarius subalbicans]MCI2399950.1 GFA family protein [Aliiroseovarius subalbicans]
MQGKCMCGAVTVTATPTRKSLSACHCDMCRAWTSGAFIAMECAPGNASADGPVKVLETSDWARRAACAHCGSPLWYELKVGPVAGQRQVAAGLFPDLGDMRLGLELYIDKKPHGYAFAGADQRKQMTEADMIAMFAPKDGEDR